MNFGKVGGLITAAVCLVAGSVCAQQAGNLMQQGTTSTQQIVGESYKPGIWVDPDGCEHWVMDDGVEGYMTPKLDRNGRPTCRGSAQNVCGVLSSDTLFATDSYRLSARAQQNVVAFFAQGRGNSYAIVGHTDSRASDAYNMRLSVNRARSVANIARRNGVQIVDVRGMGERQPVASNTTRQGMAQNRRVEIMCVN